MLESVRRFVSTGKPVYAECGGLMYLAQGIEGSNRERHALVGLLPTWTRMLQRRKALSYVEVTLTRDSLLGKKGEKFRGHEFHYSELVGNLSESRAWTPPYLVKRRRSGAATLEGFQNRSTVASYVHAHFASLPGAVEHFVSACTAKA